MLTIRPHSARAASGRAWRMQRTAVSAPWSNARSQASSDRSSNRPAPEGPTALISAWTSPHVASISPNAAATSSSLGHIGPEGQDCVRPGVLHSGLRPLELLAVTAEDGDVSTSCGEALRHGQADAG